MNDDWQDWLSNERTSQLEAHLMTLHYLLLDPPPDDPALYEEYMQFCSDADDIVLELHRRECEEMSQ